MKVRELMQRLDKDLKLVFPNDSIVRRIGGDEFTGNKNNIEILDKTGKQLLILEPAEALDSTSVIETIQVIDNRYRTQKNITTLSTFKDIADNYKISRSRFGWKFKTIPL